MKNYFKDQIRQISESLALRGLGIGLALTHLITAYEWFFKDSAVHGRPNQEMITCWGFAPDCAAFRPQLILISGALGWLYAAVGLLAILFFIKKTWVSYAYGLMAVATLIKAFYFFQDIAFTGNYHYMPLVLCLVFLLVSDKVWAVRLALIAFYISAGFLKINPEWMSGSAIPTWWIDPRSPMQWIAEHNLLPVACAYVVILETIFVFGLLSKRNFIFWPVFVQFLLFHISSYWIVGYLYPAIMLPMLIIFPLHHICTKQSESSKNILRRSPALASTLLIFGLQFIPMLSGPNSSLTGEGRMFALNMFDALSVCSAKAIAHVGTDFIEVTPPSETLFSGVRFQCDPLVYFDRIRALCKAYEDNPEFKGISFGLIARRTSELNYRQIANLPNACAADVHYSHFGFNDWIQK